MSLQFYPIEPKELFDNRERTAFETDIEKSFRETYLRTGYQLPWVGYWIHSITGSVVGCGGYKGKPVNGAVEIAYGVLEGNEGKGIGTEICRSLVEMAKKENPMMLVKARTMPEHGASTKILERNGFIFSGKVIDPDDGEVWEWILA